MLAKILLITGLFLTFPLASSCTNNNANYSNEKFQRQYGGQVNDILKNRDIQKRNFGVRGVEKSKFNLDPNFKLYSKPAQILASESLISKSPSFETHKLFLKRPEIHFPTAQTYLTNKDKTPASKIPDNIFEVEYNTESHPPFQITGIDFDIIVIPKKDAFGISSSLNKKTYPIPGNNYVSKNVNSIINNKTAEDIEFTEKLIAEQKIIRKQIAVASLYESDNANNIIGKDSYDYNNAKEEWVVEKRKKKDDQVNKIIGMQVISKNLKTSLKSKSNPANQPVQNPANQPVQAK